MLMLYGLAFCAVSLAIVWGTTLERIKFGAYVIYAIVFGAVVYPLIAHAVWGGGLLLRHRRQAGDGFRRLLGRPPDRRGRYPWRRCSCSARVDGKFDAKGQAARDPGALDAAGRPRGDHPLDRLVRLQQAGPRSKPPASFFGEVMLNTQLAAAAGVIGACLSPGYLKLEVARWTSAWRATGRSPGLVGDHRPVRASSSAGRHR